MSDAVILGAVRSPIGKRNGVLSGIHPADLAAQVLNGLVERVGIDPGLVDDVIWGCVSQTGEQAANIGRYAVLSAGWPESVPATTVDRQCGSSQQSVHFAAAGLVAGHYDVVVAGGVESMSRVPMLVTVDQGPGVPNSAAFDDRYCGVTINQGIGAEMIAAKWGVSRQQADEIALRSHQRADAAITEGRFEAQIVPISVPGDGSVATVVSRDEGVRPDASLEKMATLRPAFQEDGIVTAANSSQISDGSSAILLASSDKARELGIRPLARVHSVALAGVDPVSVLTGPIPATAKVLARSGLSLDEIGVFEVNEAFASVIGAWEAEYPVDDRRLNPNGGAIAIGHPLGASGARVMTTMLYEMLQRGHRYGLQAICEGGGMANATILENLTLGV